MLTVNDYAMAFDSMERAALKRKAEREFIEGILNDAIYSEADTVVRLPLARFFASKQILLINEWASLSSRNIDDSHLSIDLIRSIFKSAHSDEVTEFTDDFKLLLSNVSERAMAIRLDGTATKYACFITIYLNKALTYASHMSPILYDLLNNRRKKSK